MGVQKVRGLAVVAAVATLAGCGGDDLAPLTVRASEYGERWPLVAGEARLYCNRLGERYVAVDGATYALNGKALTAGMQRPDAILKDPEKLNVADFTERAGALCKGAS